MDDYRNDKDFMKFSRSIHNFSGVMAICSLLSQRGHITGEEYRKCIAQLRKDADCDGLFECSEKLELVELKMNRKPSAMCFSRVITDTQKPLGNQSTGGNGTENRKGAKVDVCIGDTCVKNWNLSSFQFPVPLLIAACILGLILYCVKAS